MLGSIPGAVVALGVFAVLVLVRLASLMFPLKGSSEATKTKHRKEAPMKMVRKIAGVIAETVWALGVAVWAGTPLLP